MPNVKNQETLAKIKEDLDGVSAVWVVDYCGLTVKDIQALRVAIRESGASMKVYKNTLMHIALDEAGLPTLDDILEGPSAFVFAGADVAAAAKAVKTFAKTNQNLEIKGGLMEGEQVSAARWRLSLLSRPAKSSWLRSPALSPVLPAALPWRSTACRVVWRRSRRPWPTRRKLLNRSVGGAASAA